MKHGKLECMEQGEINRTREILDSEGSLNNLKDLENENEIMVAMIETNKKITEQEINILFTEIDRLKLVIQKTGKYSRKDYKKHLDEIERCYMNIEHYQEKLGLDITVLFDYAEFLADQNKYDIAIEKYKKELARCKKQSEINSDEYLPYVAKTQNSLALMQFKTYRHAEAKTNYTEALKIWKKYADADPVNYLRNVAVTLDGLAEMQFETYQNKESEENYIELQEIYKKLKDVSPDDYWDVAKSDGCLNILQSYKNNNEKMKNSNNECPEFINTEFLEHTELGKKFACLIYKIYEFKNKAEREGIQAATDGLKEQKDIFEYGIQLVVDDIDLDYINNTITNQINMEQDDDVRRLKLIQKEAVLDIKKGRRNNKYVFWNLLISYMDNNELFSVMNLIKNTKLYNNLFKMNWYYTNNISLFNHTILEEENKSEDMEHHEFMNQLVLIIKKTIEWYEKAKREGLLALQDELDNERVWLRDIFVYGMSLAIEGLDSDIINSILSNLIMHEKNEEIRILKTIQKEAVIFILTGESLESLHNIIISNVNNSELEVLKNIFSDTDLFNSFKHCIYNYIKQGQYDLAIETCNEAIKNSPLDDILYEELVNIYISLGKYELAIERYTEAIKIYPNVEVLRKGLGRVYYIRGEFYNEQKQYNLAIKDFTEAIMLDPKYHYYNIRGDTYKNNNQYDLALEDFSEVIKQNPDYYSYNKRGNTYYMQGQYELAINDYTEVIKLNKYRYHEDYNNRGKAYFDNGQYNLAIKDYTEAIKLAPYNESYYNNRGNAYCNNTQYDLAIKDYTEAIKRDPDEVVFYSNRGYAYKMNNQYDMAVEDFSEAIRINPDFKDAYKYRDEALNKKRKYDLGDERIIKDPKQIATINQKTNLLTQNEIDQILTAISTDVIKPEDFNSIEESNSEFANESEDRMILFEDIILLDDRSIQKVLREIYSQELAIALKDTNIIVKEKIFQNMSNRASSMLKEDIEYMRSVKIKHIEKSQQLIISIINHLIACGEIEFNKT